MGFVNTRLTEPVAQGHPIPTVTLPLKGREFATGMSIPYRAN